MEIAVNRVEYVSKNNSIYLFGRDADKKRRTIKVGGFRPYFYSTNRIQDDAVIKIEKSDVPTFDGKEVYKITVSKPADVSRLREQSDRHYEADIPFVRRFLIDNQIKCGVLIENGKLLPVDDVENNLRLCYLDIEVASLEKKVPDVLDAKYPVIAICFYDNYTSQYYSYVLGELKDINWNVKTFETERELLKAFASDFASFDFDIITGWNVSKFDLPYLITRLKKLKLNPGTLSPLNKCFVNKNEAVISGRSVFDLLYSYIKLHEKQLVSYKLDYIANLELGRSKIELKDDITTVWRENPMLVATYNKNDVSLVVDIDKKVGIITEFYDEIRKIVGASFDDVLMPSVLNDILLLRQCHNKLILPSLKRYKQTYIQAAVVYEPTPGIYDSVAVLDLKSSYPMIIKSLNISPDTICDDGDIIVGKYRYKSNPRGILPQILDNLLALREEKRRLMLSAKDKGEFKKYDNQCYAMKFIINSIRY